MSGSGNRVKGAVQVAMISKPCVSAASAPTEILPNSIQYYTPNVKSPIGRGVIT